MVLQTWQFLAAEVTVLGVEVASCSVIKLGSCHGAGIDCYSGCGVVHVLQGNERLRLSFLLYVIVLKEHGPTCSSAPNVLEILSLDAQSWRWR